jgi:hypothetical protein
MMIRLLAHHPRGNVLMISLTYTRSAAHPVDRQFVHGFLVILQGQGKKKVARRPQVAACSMIFMEPYHEAETRRRNTNRALRILCRVSARQRLRPGTSL